MSNGSVPSPSPTVSRVLKKDADYVFYELTRSICPKCRRVSDAKIVLRENKVFMVKRCPDCGPFEALVYSDAEAYTSFGRFNKPGTIPLAYGTDIREGRPHTDAFALTTSSILASASLRSTARAIWIARSAFRKLVPDSA